MNTRQRNVLIRMGAALLIFIYVGYIGWKNLPRFDFWVMAAFFALYLIWQVVFEFWIYQDPDDFVTLDNDKKSYLYLQLAFMMALLFAAIDFLETHYTRNMDWEPTVIYVGFGLFIISCAVRWWGFKSIGKFFNPRVSIYENHQLVTTGAYKMIRHPLYLGSLLSFIAIPMVFNSWGAMLIMLLATVPALIYRIKIEEELLIRHFGDEYLDYMQKTKKVIPWVW